MNEILIHVLECGLRVSLIAGATLGCVVLAGRRRPAARAAISTIGLVSILWLTVAAGLPMPKWLSWNFGTVRQDSAHAAGTIPDASSAQDPPFREEHAAEAPDAAAGGARLDVAAAARRLVGSRRRSVEPAPAHWPLVILSMLGGGAALGVARLGWSLATALRIGRQSHPVPDAGLHALLGEIARRLRCSRPISLRESAELTSAAAVGWPRARIVLPIDWREWSGQELEGVLAHEVAHVLRRDFLTRCAALLAGAVHFYHPLVGWLTRQLVLNQELSADEMASRAAGGHRTYLHALSRLALREDDRSRSESIAGLPVFSGFLIRRIEMLQAMDGKRCGESRPWLQWTVGIVLVVLSVAVAGIRGTAAPPADEPTTTTQEVDKASSTRIGPVGAAEAFTRTPIDPSAIVLPGLPPGQEFAHGAFVIRVADLWKQPGFPRTFREIVAPALVHGPKWENWIWKDVFGSSEAPDLGLEDIEYVLGNLHLTLTPIGDQPAGASQVVVREGQASRRLMFGSNLVQIRLRKPLDWPQLARCLPEATQDRHQDLTFLKLLVPEIGPVPICLFPADERTLVICSMDIVHRVIEGRSTRHAAPAWIEHWKAADGGLVTLLAPSPAAALSVACADLQSVWQSPASPPDRASVESAAAAANLHSRIIAVLNESPCLAAGIDWADRETMQLKLHLGCGAKTTPEAARDILGRLLFDVRRAVMNAHKPASEPRLTQFVDSLSVAVSDRTRGDAPGVTVKGVAHLPIEALLFGPTVVPPPGTGDQGARYRGDVRSGLRPLPVGINPPRPASGSALPANGEVDASQREQRHDRK